MLVFSNARRLEGPSRLLLSAIVALLAVVYASSAAACPDWQQNGTQLNYTSDTLWTPRAHSVVAGGQNNLNNCPMPGVGYVTTAPDFTLHFSGNAMGRDLEFRVQAACDTVLLVNDASANWHFNDDSDGFNPRVRLSGARDGIYDIWVGTYGPSTCAATLTLETFGASSVTPPPPPSAACPDWSLGGQQLTYGAEALWQPRSMSVTAGGSINLANCGSVPGVGHVAQRPDFTLNFNENNAGRDLEFRVQGSCDTVLLVNDAGGQWHFVDDADGTLNPRLRLGRASPGQYDIWVGTYGPSTCAATLALETFGGGVTPPPPPPVAACPDWQLSGQQINYGAEALWQPRSFNVTAGGSINLANCGSVPGVGHVAQRPDFTLNFNENNAGRDLEFRVQGSCDTVLLVNDSRGQWHFVDDADGSTNPRLRLSRATPGQYDIWVGTYGSSTCSATFTAETFGGGVTPPPPPPPPPGAMPALAGTWAMVANNHPSTLQLNWTGSGWTGTAFGENLQNISFDPASGRVEFLRPGPAQHYVGYLRNGQLSGEFNQGAGSAYQYRWSATLTQSSLPPPPPPPPVNVLPDPGNVTGYRNQVGQTFTFQLTGAASGSVWGSDIYTDDSSVARAAVHAGLLSVGQPGVVRVTILPGQQSYLGTMRNGVQTSNYGAWSGSFRFVDQGASAPHPGGVRGARLLGVVTRSDADYVSAGERIAPSGRPDAQFRIGVEAPGDTITSIEIRNTSGTYSVWDTIPGNAYWTLAAVSGGQLLSRADNSVSIPLGTGEMVLDLYVEASGDQVADGRTGYTITLTMQSGQNLQVVVPADRPSGLTQSQPPVPAGLIRVVSATYGGNCGAPQGNVTDHIAAQCNGQGTCDYVINYQVIGDPAVGCSKNYVVSFECGDGLTHTRSVAPEAGFRRTVTLECPMQAGQLPPSQTSVSALAGTWAMVANNHPSSLQLTWTGSGWIGTAFGENLQNISFDPASGRVEFLRPGPAQHYVGYLRNGQLSGEFNQGAGSAYQYRWSAALSQSGVQPPPPSPSLPPAMAGSWDINANNYRGRLVLNWSVSGWSGHVNYAAHNRDEPLESISFDPASGQVQFTRPIPGATQIYRGTLSGNQMSGQFNQSGGDFVYNWTASR